MSENKNDGGSAFPSHGTMGVVLMEGMTLRDYFAAHASEEDITYAARRFMAEKMTDLCSREEARYFHADAMLKERDKP